MNTDYGTSEVLEIGNAEDLILGKIDAGPDDLGHSVDTYDDFDE